MATTNAPRKFDRRWFIDRLEAKEITQAKLAALLERDPAAVTRMLHGRRRMQMNDALLLAEVLAVELDEVLLRAGLDPSPVTGTTVPIAGVIGADGVFAPGRVDLPRQAPRPPGCPADAVAARFEGTPGMDAWLVYWDPAGERATPSCTGRLCMVRGENPENGSKFSLIGVLTAGYLRGTQTITAWVPGGKMLKNVFVDFCSPILWVRTAI